MEMDDNKEIKQDSGSRRDFLVKAGFASVPLLMSFKSRATWGSDTLNCGLSATASQIASMTAQSGKKCKEHVSHKICDVDYFGSPHGCFKKPSHKIHKYNGKEIHQDTRFKDVFGGSKTRKLSRCINDSPDNFDRNISYCFLYALYMEKVIGRPGDFPSPGSFVNAYQVAAGQARTDLVKLVAFYVNGY